jgi:hypothetical protein
MGNSEHWKFMIGEELLCTLNIALSVRAGKENYIWLCCCIFHILDLFIFMTEHQWYKSLARSEAETNKEWRLPNVKFSGRW